MRMQSLCRFFICISELWSWAILLTLAKFLMAIICCANVRVLTVSPMLASSGPMLAMSRARALPPRQSLSSMVSAESRCPCERPMFMLLTTVLREERTRLMPIACFLLSSSSASEAACTFLRLSEPARSTSISLPRRHLASLAPRSPAGERLSTESMRMQCDLEEWQFREVSMKVQRLWPCASTSHSSSGVRIGTLRRLSQTKAWLFAGSCFTSSFRSSSVSRSMSCSRVPSPE
mmetsp:Transcript_65513/g.192125  ORF Transcript_65513/g.192125 Transcript_65513/m.192125 type:complete len:234 (-) Transcript_65513:594-1295(-)